MGGKTLKSMVFMKSPVGESLPGCLSSTPVRRKLLIPQAVFFENLFPPSKNGEGEETLANTLAETEKKYVPNFEYVCLDFYCRLSFVSYWFQIPGN